MFWIHGYDEEVVEEVKDGEVDTKNCCLKWFWQRNNRQFCFLSRLAVQTYR